MPPSSRAPEGPSTALRRNHKGLMSKSAVEETDIRERNSVGAGGSVSPITLSRRAGHHKPPCLPGLLTRVRADLACRGYAHSVRK